MLIQQIFYHTYRIDFLLFPRRLWRGGPAASVIGLLLATLNIIHDCPLFGTFHFHLT